MKVVIYERRVQERYIQTEQGDIPYNDLIETVDALSLGTRVFVTDDILRSFLIKNGLGKPKGSTEVTLNDYSKCRSTLHEVRRIAMMTVSANTAP
jgi:hypothetical protein